MIWKVLNMKMFSFVNSYGLKNMSSLESVTNSKAPQVIYNFSQFTVTVVFKTLDQFASKTNCAWTYV